MVITEAEERVGAARHHRGAEPIYDTWENMEQQ